MMIKGEEKFLRLNRIDQMIIDDIRNYPGSTQNQVVTRLLKEFSASYIYNSLKKLQNRGYIKKENKGSKIIVYV